MIEINLLPGSTRKKSGRGLPRLGGGRGGGGGGGAAVKLPPIDRTMATMAGVAVLALALVGWLHVSTSSRLEELSAEREAAVRDSIRFDQLRSQGDSLRQQVAVISQKLEIIQEIDAGRYVWPHILDELSRAVPPYVWLINVTEAASDGGPPRVRIEGRAGNLFTVGRYMREIEASPFLRAARLLSSSQIQIEERTLYEFVLEMQYEEPPPDVIRTVPLFTGREEGQ